jgi:cytoskeletal protein RodZ
VAKTKADKDKEKLEKLQLEADEQVAQVKTIAERTIRRKLRKIRRLYIALIVLAALFVVAAIAGGLAYKNLKDENNRLSNPQESAKAETERIKSQVAALIDVPKDEEPTIANVSDANKAKEQSPEFFAKAENGDRLLMYPKAKKAILYRPSSNKIVEVSTLNVNENGSATPAQPQPASQPDAAAPTGTEELAQ